MDEEVINHVLKMCRENFKFAERRFKFLQSMPKSLRPYNHFQVIESWEEGIKRYYETQVER